jgi:hypothetical protein
LRVVTAAALEEPLVSEPDEELPPLQLTGDEETDEALALMRATTEAIHEAQEKVVELSAERKRLVLTLRRCRPPVKFRQIADAAGSTEQTILKIHREARRDEAHEQGDHTRCAADNCPVIAAQEE